MSLWTVIYLALFGAVAAAGLWDDVRDRRPTWFLGCVVISKPLAFVASMCWELFQAVVDIRVLRSDAEPSEGDQRLIASIAAIALAAVCLPAFVIAGMSAFRS
jgi:hypothetical protein